MPEVKFTTRKLPQPKPESCSCGYTDFWQTKDGAWNCRRCAPDPAHPESYQPKVFSLDESAQKVRDTCQAYPARIEESNAE